MLSKALLLAAALSAGAQTSPAPPDPLPLIAPSPPGPFPAPPPMPGAQDLVWRRGPQTLALARYFPDAAKRYGVDGRSAVECVVGANGALTGCTVRSEEPAGFAFGAAALRASAGLALQPTSPRGVSIVGQRVTQPFQWRLDEDDPPTAPDCFAHLMAEELLAAASDHVRRERIAGSWAARLAAVRRSEARGERERLKHLAAAHLAEPALLATPQAKANAARCRSLYPVIDAARR